MQQLVIYTNIFHKVLAVNREGHVVLLYVPGMEQPAEHITELGEVSQVLIGIDFYERVLQYLDNYFPAMLWDQVSDVLLNLPSEDQAMLANVSPTKSKSPAKAPVTPSSRKVQQDPETPILFVESGQNVWRLARFAWYFKNPIEITYLTDLTFKRQAIHSF